MGDAVGASESAFEQRSYREFESLSLPPPVCPVETFFLRCSASAGTPQNAGFCGHLSEPRAAAARPISGRFPSLSAHFLQRNRTKPVLVRMLKAGEFNGLGYARRGEGLKVPRSGKVHRNRNNRFLGLHGVVKPSAVDE